MSVSAIPLSGQIADAAEQVLASVVRLDARSRGHATGVLYAADVIVSARHVIEEEEGIEVHFAGGRTARARLVGADPATDLAVLRLEDGNAGEGSVARFEDVGKLRPGELVLSVGRLGRGPRVQLGVLSCVGEAWRTYAGGRIDRYLEASVPLHPGFSGSALADLHGRVLGVLSAGLLRGTPVALPTATVRRVVEAMLAGGLRRGYLGVSSQPVRLPGALAQSVGQGSGLLVSAVQPGSPADQAGVLLGDVIVSLDGRPVRQLGELLELLEGEAGGREVPVRVVRAGTLQELRVKLGVRP